MKETIHIDSNTKIKEVFNRYYKALVVFANTFILDIQECEDVVQNTLLQLWESKKNFPNDVALKSYLYTVVKNKCLNKIKHHKVKENHQLQNKKEPEDSVLIEEGIIIQESAKLLHEGITNLSPRKKEIIDLALKGLSNKTISERLSIEIDTVKSLKSKAYKILKTYLEKRV